MDTTVFKLLFITLCFIFMPLMHTAASSPETSRRESNPYNAPLCTYPLMQLSADLFAVGRHNELVTASLNTDEHTSTISLARHPDYFINRVPDDTPTAAHTESLECPNYIIIQKDPNKICISPENLISSIEIKLAPTRHQSTILGCARLENTVASVSPWYIMLTHHNSNNAPEIIAHTYPKLMPIETKTYCKATLGRFGSDNWMRCIAIKKEMIATGQFDGSIFLWALPHDATKEPYLIRPRMHTFTESRTVKQLQFSSDGKALFALNRHGLTKILLSDFPTKVLPGFRKKPTESAHFESMFYDEEHETIYVGTASGSIYRYQLKLKNIELLTDLSGFSSPDKKINVIKKMGAVLYLGTNGGNLYAYNPSRHPSMQKVIGDDTSAICDLLPIDDNTIIISRQNGTLQKINVAKKRIL